MQLENWMSNNAENCSFIVKELLIVTKTKNSHDSTSWSAGNVITCILNVTGNY